MNNPEPLPPPPGAASFAARLRRHVNRRTVAWAAIAAVVAGLAWLYTPDEQRVAPGPWRDWEIPTDPAEKAQYDFAHAIELPPQAPPSSDYYREGFLGFGRTGAWDYFQHLCATEAGEYIFRTVEGVDGVVQLRPRKHPRTEEFQDRYRMEDPAGWTSIEADEPQALFLGRRPWHYDYFESPQPAPTNFRKLDYIVEATDAQREAGSSFWSYESPPREKVVVTPIDRPTARYGYTWRGIRRPKDRENGIAGGEIIVLDLRTGEVLAVRRSFTVSGRQPASPTGIHWEFSGRCPRPKTIRERFRGANEFVGVFMNRVLISTRMNEQPHEEN